MRKPIQETLHHFFKTQAIRWSVIGFLLTVCFTVPSAIYVAKVASERQVLTVAKSAANAYRRQIVDGHVRDAQFQMRGALSLSEGETAIVRDAALAPIYPMPGQSGPPECAIDKPICWSKGLQYVHYLYPIYYDEETKKELFGFLDVTLRPLVDQKIFGLLFAAICLAFIVQAIGLSSVLIRSGKKLTEQLSNWATHLRDRPTDSLNSDGSLQFSEVALMQEAVSGLHIEIKRLEQSAAAKAKDAAQLSILRELGHELKTPLSQLAKFFSVLTHSARATGKLNEEIVGDFERILTRMGDIVRQVRALNTGNIDINGSALRPGTTGQSGFSMLDRETRLFLSDLEFDPEISQKSVKIRMEDGAAINACAKIAPVAFHRILENLVRNAIHAVDAHGEIVIGVQERHGGHPTLFVKDNGSGISPEVQDQIFDFDFTTKPSRGTGLGLGIVKKLCTEVDAEITFVSETGKGTTFEVLFRPHSREC